MLRWLPTSGQKVTRRLRKTKYSRPQRNRRTAPRRRLERLGTASGSSEKPKGHSDGANPADTTLAPPSPLSPQVAVVRHALVFGRPFLRAKSMLRRPVFACFTLQGFDRHAHKIQPDRSSTKRSPTNRRGFTVDVARVCRGAVSQRCLAPRSPRRLVCS